jgi:hypothetical protein
MQVAVVLTTKQVVEEVVGLIYIQFVKPIQLLFYKD